MEQLALQETCPEIRKIGAQLVAITPGKKPLPARTPTRTGRCADGCHGPAVRGTLSVLWDQGNRVAHLFGLKDDFSVATKDLYRAAAVDIEEINGAEAGWTLPLASTYIIDRTSVIRHAVVTADWRIRRDPNDTLKRLKELVADQFLRAALGFVTCSMPRTWALRRRIRIVHFGKIEALWLISSRQCCATASPTRPNRRKHLHRRAKARRLAATHPSRPTLAQEESRRDL